LEELPDFLTKEKDKDKERRPPPRGAFQERNLAPSEEIKRKGAKARRSRPLRLGAFALWFGAFSGGERIVASLFRISTVFIRVIRG
jgi:hypothetical protein